jgi:DNA-directed RNA polymerase subunit E'/Rpb7
MATLEDRGAKDQKSSMAAQQDSDGLFEETTAIHYLHLSPKYIGSLTRGVEETLTTYLLKWSGPLLCVPLALISFDSTIDDKARIVNENPQIHLHVRAKWLTFVPKVGKIMEGTISKQSPDHLGVLVLGYFNGVVQAMQMASMYVWDAAGHFWVDRASRDPIILGQKIKFKVIEYKLLFCFLDFGLLD